MKWAIIIALCVLTGCKTDNANTPRVEKVDDQPFSIAQWDFVNRDADGKEISKGLLTLPGSLMPGAMFAGSWQARYVGPIGEENKFGPQITGGRLTGEVVQSGEVILHLNPNMSDNNVTLRGKVIGDSIKGTWEYDTIAGKTNGGAFEAVPSK